LLAEVYAVPMMKRPFWVAQQVEVAFFEGLGERIRARSSRPQLPFEVQGDFIVMLDSDPIPSPDELERLFMGVPGMTASDGSNVTFLVRTAIRCT
jgi:hypothetical protein